MTVVSVTGAIPVAFLCHGSEDKSLARQLAIDLRSHGIDVFFDEWGIGPGDSIRRKIDGGLGRCTHILALLTTRSLNKAWVNTEMDAGFVRAAEGSAKFIPLRAGLAAGLTNVRVNPTSSLRFRSEWDRRPKSSYTPAVPSLRRLVSR